MSTNDQPTNPPQEETSARSALPPRPLQVTVLKPEPIRSTADDYLEPPMVQPGRLLRPQGTPLPIPPAPIDLPLPSPTDQAHIDRLDQLAEEAVLEQIGQVPTEVELPTEDDVLLVDEPEEIQPVVPTPQPVDPVRVDISQTQSLMDRMAEGTQPKLLPPPEGAKLIVHSRGGPEDDYLEVSREDPSVPAFTSTVPGPIPEPVSPRTESLETQLVDLTTFGSGDYVPSPEYLRNQLAHLQRSAVEQEMTVTVGLPSEEVTPEPPLTVPLDQAELADATHDDEPLLPPTDTTSGFPADMETVLQPAPEDQDPIDEEEIPPGLVLLPIHVTELDEYLDNLSSKHGEKFLSMYQENRGVPGRAKAAVLTLNGQTQLSEDALTMASEQGAELATRKQRGERLFGDAVVGKAQMLTLPNQKNTVQGRSALMLAMATTQGLRKVYLLNSGFYLMLRPPKLSELNAFYILARDSEKKHGRTYGAYFYLPSDTDVKKAAMELLEQLVVDSNLKDWSKPKAIRKALSLQDYDTVLWAIASLMYKQGVDVHYMCHYKDCMAATPFRLDVATMRLNNYTRLGDAIDLLMDDKVKDLNALEEYRRMLGLAETIRCSDEWSIDVDVPTMHAYLNFSDRFNAEMATKIQVTDRQEVTAYLRYSYNRILSPWISAIKLTSQGKEMKVTEPSTIPEILETIQLSEVSARMEASERLANRVHEYIKRTKLTHICYPYSSCPKCGGLADTAVGDVTPCDMQSSFFMLSVMKLSD